MKKCPFCGAEMSDDSLFCTECGKELSKGNKCPHCGATVSYGDAYCQNCGKSINESQTVEPIIYEEETKKGIKKYWQYILGAVVLFVIICFFCLNQNNSSNTTSDAVSTVDDTSSSPSVKEQIKKRVVEIFDDVNKGNVQDCDDRYFSSDFKQIYKEVTDIDDRLAKDGLLGFFDFTFWECSQEEVKLSATVDDIYDITDNQATAKITFKYDYGSETNTQSENIKVVLEDGKWVLDDLHSYKEQMKEFVKENKDYQPFQWLQGHWVYEQGNYKGHFVIQGNTLTMYSSMNPEPLTYTYRIDGDELYAGEMTVKLSFGRQSIDYGDGNWMHKVE